MGKGGDVWIYQYWRFCALFEAFWWLFDKKWAEIGGNWWFLGGFWVTSFPGQKRGRKVKGNSANSLGKIAERHKTEDERPKSGEKAQKTQKRGDRGGRSEIFRRILANLTQINAVYLSLDTHLHKLTLSLVLIIATKGAERLRRG